jgi:hypothetical protein
MSPVSLNLSTASFNQVKSEYFPALTTRVLLYNISPCQHGLFTSRKKAKRGAVPIEKEACLLFSFFSIIQVKYLKKVYKYL